MSDAELIQTQNVSDLKEEELYLFTDESVSSDSVIPIRWCVSKSVFEGIRIGEITNPYILLVIAHKDTTENRYVETERKLIPLDKMMDYVSFERPGSYRIFADIVWHLEGEIEQLKEIVFNTPKFLDYRGDYFSFERCYCVDIRKVEGTNQAKIEVDIAKEFFAKDPPKWMAKWVNLFFDGKMPNNQCEFRRRYFFAFSFQPILVLSWAILISLFRGLAVLSLVLCGIRKIKFQPIVRPFKYKTNYIWQQKAGSIFFISEQGQRRSPLLMPFTPIFPAICLLIMCSLKYSTSYEISIWAILASILLIFIATLLVIAVIEICAFVFNWFDEKYLSKFFDLFAERRRSKNLKRDLSVVERQEEKLRAGQLAKEREIQAKYSALVCPGSPLDANINALPGANRTFYLRYREIKSKVCKPFAKK